jgi:hypothetical protein
MTAGTGPELPEPTAAELSDPGLDVLMDRLRALGERDAPPALVDTLARAAFETRDLDAELALLTGDSSVDAVALVRGTGTAVAPRMLSFETDTVGIELELDHTGDTVAVRGLITGIDPGRSGPALELDTGTERIPLAIDPHGWFRATDVPVGMLRLRLTGPDSGAVLTPWISTRSD